MLHIENFNEFMHTDFCFNKCKIYAELYDVKRRAIAFSNKLEIMDTCVWSEFSTKTIEFTFQ